MEFLLHIDDNAVAEIKERIAESGMTCEMTDLIAVALMDDLGLDNTNMKVVPAQADEEWEIFSEDVEYIMGEKYPDPCAVEETDYGEVWDDLRTLVAKIRQMKRQEGL